MGGTEQLSAALSSAAGEHHFESVAGLIGDLGVQTDDGIDFHLPSASGLLYDFVKQGRGTAAALGYVGNFALRRDIVARGTNLPIALPTDFANATGDGADDFGLKLAHTAQHLAKGENPLAEGVSIKIDGGKKGGPWPVELNVPGFHANSSYKVNGYTYFTDSEGRVVRVTGTLSDDRADRNGYRQRQVARSSGVPGDQGWHLIASIFNGPGDRLNLVPMDGTLNMVRWRNMERGWQSLVANSTRVTVDISVIYSGSSTRPAGFVVAAQEGTVPKIYSFKNDR